MRVVVNEFMSLDGVVQAPGGPAEDLDGGFAHPALLDFLDAEPNLEYVVAVAKNPVLERRAEEAMQYARVLAGVTGQTEHVYGQANYAAGSWERERRIHRKFSPQSRMRRRKP